MTSSFSPNTHETLVEKIDPVYNMCWMTSIFEVLQCIGETVHIMYEYNYNRTKKERLEFIDLLTFWKDSSLQVSR
jgi:hypothetical protein